MKASSYQKFAISEHPLLITFCLSIFFYDHKGDPKKDWTEKKGFNLTTGGIRAGRGKSPFSS
jgi:hypothetical protein